MEKITLWLSNISCAALAIFSVCASAELKKTVTFDLSFEQYGIPYTTFIINGNPVYAMVDTGSSFGFHLQESQLKKVAGLKKVRTYRSVDGRGKVQHNVEYLADSLDVNGIQLKDITITPFKQWGLKISGDSALPETPVAGIGIFNDKQLLLDYQSKSMVISENIDYDALIKKGYSEFFFQLSADGLVFDVEQSGHKYHLILDTGATVSMVWSERLKSAKIGSCLLVDPEMDNKGCEATLFDLISKGGDLKQFGAVVVAGDFKHMGNIDGFIGNNFLKERKILIDFKNNKIFISDASRKG